MIGYMSDDTFQFLKGKANRMVFFKFLMLLYFYLSHTFLNYFFKTSSVSLWLLFMFKIKIKWNGLSY